MIGQDLGGRYEILDRIGGGGMALVYKANDNILNRHVAIKVLRQQYVHDEDFIRRFRREAQSAASLSHPNVVNIYDVGQVDDIHYIVMEYIDGSNLNEYIKSSAPLSVGESIRFAAQICDALSHAHTNGIIHRDIKPHNILIGEDGRVKVTDFGIARAAASTDITQTGSVIGSVHYFSPEHAKGVSQGEQSDLYSLGIVLYQMLTGSLPFFGDSPISIALKHLQEHVQDPRQINPSIPQSVENIILKALQKKPENRYESAADMLEDLETCLMPERLDEPKVQFPVDGDTDHEHTRVIPAIRGAEFADSTTFDMPRAFTIPGENDGGSSKRWLKPTIGAAIVIIVLIGIWLGFRAFMGKFDVAEVEVPDVTGLTLEEARAELEALQLVVSEPVFYEYSDEVEEGRVIRQTRAGMTVSEQTPVSLTVSNGPQLAIMDRYIGMPFENVLAQLKRLGLDDDRIDIIREHSEQAEGTVIAQFPEPNESYHPGQDVVVLTVSDGPGTFEMPDLIGRSLQEAEAILIRHNLILAEDGIREEESLEVEEGFVTDQFPVNPGEQVEPGTEIILFVSSGYPDELLNPVVQLRISPTQDNEPSTVMILYSDASGESQEWGSETITDERIFEVPVYVEPEGSAVITYYIDGHFGDSVEITYDMASESSIISFPDTEHHTEDEQSAGESESDELADDDSGNTEGSN